jgi:hypothetical protein
MPMQQVSGCASCGVVVASYPQGFGLMRRLPCTGRRSLMRRTSATQGTGSIRLTCSLQTVNQVRVPIRHTLILALRPRPMLANM